MSREVRRVPVGWKHPVVHNPHWQFQDEWRRSRGRPTSRLHAPDEQFKPLYGGPLSVKQAAWDQGKAEWDAGTHSGFRFLLKYFSSEGYLNDDGTRDEPVPYRIYADDGETIEREVFFASVADVQANYPFEEEEGSRPDADRYMPDFDEPEDELGWCLYETVSEGTPCTPVFATAEELIDHLCTVGQDYDQEPMRRASAEQIVRTGFTVGSLVSTGGKVYRSDYDADVIAALPTAEKRGSRP